MVLHASIASIVLTLALASAAPYAPSGQGAERDRSMRNKITIRIGDKAFTATLSDNATAAAFKKLMPFAFGASRVGSVVVRRCVCRFADYVANCRQFMPSLFGVHFAHLGKQAAPTNIISTKDTWTCTYSDGHSRSVLENAHHCFTSAVMTASRPHRLTVRVLPPTRYYQIGSAFLRPELSGLRAQWRKVT
jgi:hypothetical protein